MMKKLKQIYLIQEIVLNSFQFLNAMLAIHLHIKAGWCI